MDIDVHPATADRWPDLEMLFGQNGACGGCWCMFWRLKRSDYKQLQGEGTKAVLRDLTLKNEIPGMLAYVDGQAVGWISIGPRQQYLALENSRILKRLDDQPVWSIVCFFTKKNFRRQGIMLALVKGAVHYALEHQAQIIEAYPIDMQSPKLAGQRLSGSSGYMGLASVFRQAGFVEVARASETQLMMRYICPQCPGLPPVDSD